MINNKCLRCNNTEDFSEEHAFPDSLLQPGTKGWKLKTHYCEECNSILGNLVELLKWQSPIGFIFNSIEQELKRGSKTKETNKTQGRNPLRVLSYDPNNQVISIKTTNSYQNNKGILIPCTTQLRPQIILITYEREDKKKEILNKNYNQLLSRDIHLKLTENENDIYEIGENVLILGNIIAKEYLKNPEKLAGFVKTKLKNKLGELIIYPDDDLEENNFTKLETSFKLEKFDPNVLKIEVIPIKAITDEIIIQDCGILVSGNLSWHDYSRGIAMIGFHSLLYICSEKFSGREPIFDRIKKYIYSEHFDPKTQIVFEIPNPLSLNFIENTEKIYHRIDFYQAGEDILCNIFFYLGSKEVILFAIIISEGQELNLSRFGRGKQLQKIGSGKIEYNVAQNSQYKNQKYFPNTKILKPTPDEIKSLTTMDNLYKWMV